MNKEQLVKTSKKMSYALRHHPEAYHLDMDKHGWVDVQQLMHAMHLTKEEMDDVVEHNDKHRFSYNADQTKIRANQGHSIPVDVEMQEKIPPEFLYHGTGYRSVSSIKKEGLLPMTRLYVHLSDDMNTAYNVGSRHGRPYVFTVEAEKMYEDGYHFYFSNNGVWQVKYVPVKYLRGEE